MHVFCGTSENNTTVPCTMTKTFSPKGCRTEPKIHKTLPIYTYYCLIGMLLGIYHNVLILLNCSILFTAGEKIPKLNSAN